MSPKKLSVVFLLAVAPACREYQPEPTRMAAPESATDTANAWLIGRVIMEDSGAPPNALSCSINGLPCLIPLASDASFELANVPAGEVVIDFYTISGAARLQLDDVRPSDVYRIWVVLGPTPRVEMYPRDRQQEERGADDNEIGGVDFQDGSTQGDG